MYFFKKHEGSKQLTVGPAEADYKDISLPVIFISSLNITRASYWDPVAHALLLWVSPQFARWNKIHYKDMVESRGPGVRHTGIQPQCAVVWISKPFHPSLSLPIKWGWQWHLPDEVPLRLCVGYLTQCMAHQPHRLINDWKRENRLVELNVSSLSFMLTHKTQLNTMNDHTLLALQPKIRDSKTVLLMVVPQNSQKGVLEEI